VNKNISKITLQGKITMMEETLDFIRNNLSMWKEKNLNEAQTSQVIILRILQALDYDIWNPLEIFPQDTNTRGAGRPDYLIYLDNKEKFIIEIKALNKDFSNAEYTQAVNYVNPKGLRWAVLTNGIKWLFFDNSINGTIDKKLALELDINDPFFEKYLSMLLNKNFWLSKNVNEDMSHQILLIYMSKIIQEKQDDGYDKSERGLRLLIKHEFNEEQKKIAEKYFDFLLLFYLKISLIKLDNLSQSQPEQIHLNKASDLFINIISSLKGEESGKRQIKIKLNNQEFAFFNWRDIHFAMGETLVQLNKIIELENIAKVLEEDQRKLDIYPETAYSKLSNNKYIYVHYSATDHQKDMKKLLEVLDFSIEISYRDDLISLP